MKAIVFVLASVVTSVALAFPAVGDKAVFKGAYYGAAGGQIDFTQTIELVKFDETTQKYSLTNQFDLANGQSQTQNAEVEANQLLSNDTVKQILADCVAGGGTLGQTTVPAGTFQTCAVPTERNGMIYVAEVPFGFVKEVSFDEEENRIEVEMTSYVGQ